MMQAAIHGRIGKDPESRTTRNGNEMSFTSIAVDVTGFGAEHDQRETLWLNVAALGRVAGDLMRLKKGDLASLSGKVSKSRWTGKDGVEHEQLQITVDSVIGARTARPGGGRKKADHGAQKGAMAAAIRHKSGRCIKDTKSRVRINAKELIDPHIPQLIEVLKLAAEDGDVSAARLLAPVRGQPKP